MLAEASWDVALLQECPPRWVHGLARDCRAQSYRSLTSRNWLLPLTSIIARHYPDLIGSAEGGSNTILARGVAGGISEHRTFTLRWVRPERRTMAFARLGCGLCVTSLHASTSPRLAEPELIRAADRAVEWSGGSPLVLGGDFNVRPAESDVFALLAERHGLLGSTAPDAIDHLLTVGVELLEGPRSWPPGQRELEQDGLALTLSDHAPSKRCFASHKLRPTWRRRLRRRSKQSPPRTRPPRIAPRPASRRSGTRWSRASRFRASACRRSSMTPSGADA